MHYVYGIELFPQKIAPLPQFFPALSRRAFGVTCLCDGAYLDSNGREKQSLVSTIVSSKLFPGIILEKLNESFVNFAVTFRFAQRAFLSILLSSKHFILYKTF